MPVKDKLSDVAIRQAKPGSATRKLSDGGGLQLHISSAGGKLWRLAYRFEGKQRKLALGQYPVVSLAEAREKRDDAKRLLDKGIDPSRQRKTDKSQRVADQANTFSLIAAELLDKKRREGKAGATIGKREWLYGLAAPDIGAVPLKDITAPDVLAALRKIEGRGLYETAHKLRSVIGEVFRYGIATGRATMDPTYSLRGALIAKQVRHRAAIVEPRQLGELMRAIAGFQGQPTTLFGLQLLAYLFPRPGELRQAEWREFDLEAAVWTIPAARTKMRREHRVPLPVQSLAILKQLQAFTGDGRLVFPGYGRAAVEGRPMEPRPISENTLNGALRRLGYGQEDMTSHGFRATASTLLNEQSPFSPDVIEAALAHVDKDAVRRAYNRAQFWKERVAMAQWWADYLDQLRDGAKVVPLRA
jgi:integrase